jgi:hypothetical protein
MQYRITQSPNVAARSFGDEIIVANFITGVYYSLLGSAAQVWDGLMAGQSLPEVSRAVATVGDLDPAEFEQAAAKLVEDLAAENLIEPATDAPVTDWTALPPAGEAFALPVLERFTDMQDLLLLDPVHDVEEMGWPHAGPVRAA